MYGSFIIYLHLYKSISKKSGFELTANCFLDFLVYFFVCFIKFHLHNMFSSLNFFSLSKKLKKKNHFLFQYGSHKCQMNNLIHEIHSNLLMKMKCNFLIEI